MADLRMAVGSTSTSDRDIVGYRLLSDSAQEDRPLKALVLGVNVLLVPVGDYASIKETAEVLADKDFMDDVRRGLDDDAHDRIIPWDTVKKQLGL